MSPDDPLDQPPPPSPTPSSQDVRVLSQVDDFLARHQESLEENIALKKLLEDAQALNLSLESRMSELQSVKKVDSVPLSAHPAPSRTSNQVHFSESDAVPVVHASHSDLHATQTQPFGDSLTSLPPSDTAFRSSNNSHSSEPLHAPPRSAFHHPADTVSAPIVHAPFGLNPSTSAPFRTLEELKLHTDRLISQSSRFPPDKPVQSTVESTRFHTSDSRPAHFTDPSNSRSESAFQTDHAPVRSHIRPSSNGQSAPDVFYPQSSVANQTQAALYPDFRLYPSNPACSQSLPSSAYYQQYLTSSAANMMSAPSSFVPTYPPASSYYSQAPANSQSAFQPCQNQVASNYTYNPSGYVAPSQMMTSAGLPPFNALSSSGPNVVQNASGPSPSVQQLLSQLHSLQAPASNIGFQPAASGNRSSAVPFQSLPKFNGKNKGLSAKSWLRDLEQIRLLYSLSENQMIPAARFSCVEQAREWAEIQPEEQTWDEFKVAFLHEYGDRNQDQLRMDMLAFQQNDLSVSEYATAMQRYFRQIDGIPVEQQIRYFIRGLRLGLREGIFAGQPTTLSDAISMARKAEDLFTSFPEQQPEIGREVAQLKKLTHDLYLAQRQAGRNPNPSQAPPPAHPHPQPQRNDNRRDNDLPNGHIPYCPRCDEPGHTPRNCSNPAKNPYHSCCNFWKHHRDNCPNHPNRFAASNYMESAEFNSEPLPPLEPVSDVELESNPAHAPYLSASLLPSDLPNMDCFAQDGDSGYEISESESDYESSSSDSDDEAETFAQKRGREESGRDQVKFKSQKRDVNTLPRHREPVKPVLHPLTAEEKEKRNESRRKNRRAVSEQNWGILRELFKPLNPTLISHKHLKYFRTDMHHYLDNVFQFERRPRKFRSPIPGEGKAPVEPSSQASGPRQNADSNRRGVSFALDDNPISAKNVDHDTNFLKAQLVGRESSPSFPIRTEIHAQIGKLKNQVIILDSGATFSGIPESVVIAAGWQHKIRPSNMTYRTSQGDSFKALGKVRVHLRIDRLHIKATMIVMPANCSYTMLLANDVMGPLRVDLLRSTQQVAFHFSGHKVTVPMLNELAPVSRTREENYFFVTQEDAPLETAWIGSSVPEFSISDECGSKNGSSPRIPLLGMS